MKKTRFIITFLILFCIILVIPPKVISQKGTYTFHGAPGNEKVLKVTTVNNASLTDLWGVNWTEVIEIFGPGAYVLGARMKSYVTAVNFDATFHGYDVTNYTTNNWLWTTGSFPATPDGATNFVVTSFYNPTELSDYIYAFYGNTVNVTVQNAGFFLAQLPTNVNNYLAAITWNPRWEAIGNTAVHHAQVGDTVYSAYTGKFYTYNENCTEIWTYDTLYGAWIGYKVEDDQQNKIYEFFFDLGGGAEIPGYELPIIIGVASISIIGIIFVVMKKKK